MPFNEQYFIAFGSFGENQLHIKADKKTFNRDYGLVKLDEGGAPLFFKNAFAEKDKKRGVKKPISDVLFDGASLLISDSLREKLKFYDISGLQIYPAVYIDDDQHWHEDRWFMNFYQEVDCFDRKLSIIEIDDEDEEDDDADVIKYHLDPLILDEIPEEKRLMLKMGGATVDYVFVHQKIVDLFSTCQVNGVRFLKVSEFEEGDQY